MKFGEPFDLSSESREVWNQPGYRDQKFSEAAKAVARFIKQIDADVIGLVEVGSERDVRELLEEVRKLGLDYPYCVVGSRVEQRTYQNNAVFSKFELKELVAPIPGREAYDAELDDPEAERWTGVRKGLRVSFTAYGQTFHAYVLHLTSERGGHEADARRIAEASIVRRHYLPLLTSGKHLIVMGDLNDRRNEPAIRRIRGRDDIQPDLIQTGRYEYFDRDELDTRWTYDFRGALNQIDHVLLSESIEQACTRIRSRTINHRDSLILAVHRGAVSGRLRVAGWKSFPFGARWTRRFGATAPLLHEERSRDHRHALGQAGLHRQGADLGAFAGLGRRGELVQATEQDVRLGGTARQIGGALRDRDHQELLHRRRAGHVERDIGHLAGYDLRQRAPVFPLVQSPGQTLAALVPGTEDRQHDTVLGGVGFKAIDPLAVLERNAGTIGQLERNGRGLLRSEPARARLDKQQQASGGGRNRERDTPGPATRRGLLEAYDRLFVIGRLIPAVRVVCERHAGGVRRREVFDLVDLACHP
jgi:endonuclease/exonuclease/phosphatase family metal-dependent hydrolase